MDVEELKNFIKHNLVIETKPEDRYGRDNSIIIGLRFRGEKDPFTSEQIHIPLDSYDVNHD